MATEALPLEERLLPSVREFIARSHRLLIDGEQRDSQSGRTFETTDPASGATIATITEADAADVDIAVASANRALRGPWGKLLPVERERLLLRLADLVESHATELAQLDSLESGKPAHQIEAIDVAIGVAQLRYFAGWPTKIEGSTLPASVPGVHVYTRREPIGVVGAIVPWNYPLCQTCFKLAPALAAGCTVIVKPAEQTSLSALRLGELVLEAGIPEGVVNVLPGFGETTGVALVEHPGVAKITFTGSEAVGKEVMRRGAATLKHVSMELGGKNPNVIFADGDIELAAATAASAAFFYSGQICSAGSRLMVQREVHDDVVSIVVEEARKLRMGHGMDVETTLGPLISSEQLTRVSGYVDRSIAEGATAATGGSGRPSGDLANGFFHEPTVLVDVPDHMTIAREEVFGPVLITQTFDDVEELARRANETPMGLAAGVWTRDVSKAHQVAAAIQAGTVWVNSYNLFDAAVPWGGYKHSGHGRDGGREGIEKFLQTKAVWLQHG
jgi:acyl-CoA reductase-like NAD-dependent aldehyde dehydrogenase